MSRVNKESGFSLIELMIVVAIIGILAAIAIPNYQKFIRKSRQAEAKSTLEGIYTAEKAYMGEFNGATSSLSVIGFQPEGRIHYACGWAGDLISTAAGGCAQRVQADRSTTCVAGNFNTAVATVCVAPNCTDGRTDYGAAVAIAGATLPAVTPPTFNIVCAGSIGNGVAAGDVWNITQGKVLTNSVDGT